MLPRCAAVMMMMMMKVTWSASSGWSLCALATLVTALFLIAREDRHALTVIMTNIINNNNYNYSFSNSSAHSSSSAPARHARSYPHLQGDTHRRKLYSFQRLFLRIDGTGRVTGTRSTDDPHTILEITSVDVGVVAIQSLATGYYLAMNRKGEVYGEREYSVNCRLKERIEENGYNTYASAQWRQRHRAMFISLNANGKPLHGRKTHRRNTNTHFLPITV
ncbi:fibroblast growth factor 10b [Ictalurus punctatus]|uniref:Fibroblast growth factor n=1 Tax=Ictalurus punctatus TaxID=7998 RepID=A0A2D0PP86_ICTPU|nr:fibroblast growth factor 10b [Ictalurus punctatus]